MVNRDSELLRVYGDRVAAEVSGPDCGPASFALIPMDWDALLKPPPGRDRSGMRCAADRRARSSKSGSSSLPRRRDVALRIVDGSPNCRNSVIPGVALMPK